MINVIASIHIKKGRVSEFIDIFKSNIANVLADFQTNIPAMPNHSRLSINEDD